MADEGVQDHRIGRRCRCGELATPGRTKCRRCLSSNANRERERRERARETGACTVCAKQPADPGCRTCKRCRRYNAHRARALRGTA